MRLLTVCYIYPPEIQPAGVMTRELAEYTVQHGHEATVITGFPNHPRGVVFEGYRRRSRQWEQREPFGVLRVWHTVSASRATLPRLAFYGSFALSSLVNGLGGPRPDVVFSLSTPVAGGLACLLLARLKRARFVYGVWDVYPETAIQAGVLRPGWLAGFLRAVDAWVCRHADSVVAPSEGLKRVLLQRELPADRVAVLPIWIDTDEVTPLPRLNPWRAEQGIGTETLVVLYAGTIGLVSGAQYVVDVARRLQDRDVLFLFVGEGAARDEIAQRASELGLANIRLLSFQPRERLAEVQAAADISLVTLLPGHGKTSLPSKVLGYMAAARPVVAGVEEDSDTAVWIRAGECGLVVPPQDVEALAEGICRLVDNPVLRDRMGSNGRQYVVEHFSKAAALARYLAFFERMARRSAEPGSR